MQQYELRYSLDRPDRLLRPLSPSFSISRIEKSDFSFKGSFEIEKSMSGMHLINDASESYEKKTPNSIDYHIYNQKVKELQNQIFCIQELYDKQIEFHQQEKKVFEKMVMKLNNSNPKMNFFDQIHLKHRNQVDSMKEIIAEIADLQNKIEFIK
jgi:hypothetical protein